ncbi:AraC family transcriptional regulator [Paenibacillus sp. S150]|uniref:AraC family transcriptional regulator n=1 Tax=Paenibacillus sp. S150 TaxID=2749826 RepID=UPI001C5A583C|nr:AraC family transcriptional regulator [Paenibacillus sp. S150]MBW4085030.1 helix-turn-helix transcriptional regulator [Paenibacillus sp. S150]
MLRIESIISDVFIPSGRSFTWNSAANECLFIELLHPLKLEWNTFEVQLGAGSCFLARTFILRNTAQKPAAVRVIKLYIKEAALDFAKPLFFDSLCRESLLLQRLFTSLFQDHSKLMEIEKSVFPLLNQWINHLQYTISPLNLHRSIDSRLIKINRYMRAHHEEIITLQQLAEMLQCNPVYFSNTYTRVFNISPIKHLQKMKMDTAMKLLNSSNLSIKNISSRLGYVSHSQFSSIFKKHFGCTPSQYRKDLKHVMPLLFSEAGTARSPYTDKFR